MTDLAPGPDPDPEISSNDEDDDPETFIGEPMPDDLTEVPE